MKKLLMIMIMISSTSLYSASNLEKALSYYNKGCVALNNGKYNEALTQLNYAIELDSRNPNFWEKRGTAFFSMANYPSAISDYTMAITLAPSVGLYYMERALCYYAIGNLITMLNDINIAANFGNPEAQQFMATRKAQIEAEIKASSEKTKKETQRTLDERFGFKPGTIRW